MSCERFEKSIALYAEGDLAERKARRLEAHLAVCASCRELAESLAASQAALKGLRAESVDARTLEQVRRWVLEQIAAGQGAPRSWLGLAWRYVLAGVAVAIVVATLWSRIHRATPARPVVARAPIGVGQSPDLPPAARQPAAAAKPPDLTAPAQQPATVAPARLPDASESQPAIVAGNRPNGSAATRPAVGASRPPKARAPAVRARPSDLPAQAPPVIAAARAQKHQRAVRRPKAVTPSRPAAQSEPLLVKLETGDPNVVIFLLVDQNGG
jgi:hypothetical protein